MTITMRRHLGTKLAIPKAFLLIAPLVQTAVLTACTADTPGGIAALRDSVGVRISENPDLSSSRHQTWTLDSIPELEIGADPTDPAQQFGRIGDVLLLDRGVIVVADVANEEVVMFDVTAGSSHAIAHRGQGPGELTRVRGLYRCAQDTLVVNDFYRVSVFDGDGQFARSERVIPGDDGILPRIEGVSSDCSTFLLRTSSIVLPPPGEVGPIPTTLFWATLDNTRRDTVAAVSMRQVIRHSMRGGDEILTVPWGTRTHWVVGAEHVYVGISDRPEIRVYDQDGSLVRIVRWTREPRPVTRADRRLFAQKRVRWVRERPSLGELLIQLDDFPAVPTEMPVFFSLLLDDEGNLWIRDYPRWLAGWPSFYESDLRDPPSPEDDPEMWTVFDESGRLLARVRVPSDLAIRSVHGDAVLTVWRDQNDVDRVRLYRLTKQPES